MMAKHEKVGGPKTTVWKVNGTGRTLVATLRGFPFGTPATGRIVNVPGHGRATCTKVLKLGSIQTVKEIELTLK
jgi:hypothetical protein